MYACTYDVIRLKGSTFGWSCRYGYVKKMQSIRPSIHTCVNMRIYAKKDHPALVIADTYICMYIHTHAQAYTRITNLQDLPSQEAVLARAT